VSEGTGFFSIRFTAEPIQLYFFRAGLDRWLRGLKWPDLDRVDALLAVGEACSNSVEHAYMIGDPGEVEVVGRLVLGATDRRIVVVVRDHGQWREEPGDRGYGLTTVRACMARVKINHDELGTVVTMSSRPVPRHDGPWEDDAFGEAPGGTSTSAQPRF
jgi:anti-sigma regulatory factor (Ser/Thr protein kinase)